VSVVLDHAANLATSHVTTKPTAMVVARDPRVRAAATRRLWVLGVRDVVEVATVAEARMRIGTPRDLCVVDVDLPDGSGLALLAEMRSAGWQSGLALSAVDDLGAVRAALAAGVRGYVVTGTRTAPPAPGGRRMGPGPYRDMGARRPVTAPGQQPYLQRGPQPPQHPQQRPPRMGLPGAMPPGMQPPVPATPAPAPAPMRSLSDREIEVLRLVAEGRSNKAIGETMGLSALTVKSHLARIARKLGTGDRAGMVAVAMRTGIIP
jgi:DNA-binding NarL/FixJ family response regulator